MSIVPYCIHITECLATRPYPAGVLRRHTPVSQGKSHSFLFLAVSPVVYTILYRLSSADIGIVLDFMFINRQSTMIGCNVFVPAAFTVINIVFALLILVVACRYGMSVCLHFHDVLHDFNQTRRFSRFIFCFTRVTKRPHPLRYFFCVLRHPSHPHIQYVGVIYTPSLPYRCWMLNVLPLFLSILNQWLDQCGTSAVLVLVILIVLELVMLFL